MENTMSNLPIVITPGEPAGIGAEITLKAWEARSCPPFFLIDDPERVRKRAEQANLSTPINIIEHPEQTKKHFFTGLPILPCEFPVHCPPGKPSQENARIIVHAIEKAANFANERLVSAMVTNPIQKDVISGRSTHWCPICQK